MVLTITPNKPPRILSKPNTTTCNELNRHNHLLPVLNKCTDISQLKQIHAQALRTTSSSDPQSLFVFSRILQSYSLHNLQYASKLFDQIENPNSFTWNTLIRAYARSDSCKNRSFLVYKMMIEKDGVLPDNHTFPFVLKACAYLFAMLEGKQVHAQLIKFGLHSDVYVNNSLIHFYGSCGCLDSSKNVFDKMPERSVVSWNAMIDAFVRFGDFETALKLFVQLQGLFEPDGYAIQSILDACGGLSSLSLGMWVHAYVIRNCNVDVSNNVLIGNCLMDMYCKCSSLDLAVQVFESMNKHDVNSWNCMILGFAMHGKGELALECFNNMVSSGFLPNSVTFTGVLTACNHQGMVSESRMYFDMMITDYKIEPQLEHYGCLVDILARAGLITEALELVSSMPMKPDAVIWRSLLDSCCKRNAGVELSEEMAKKILESGGADCSGVYVLLSRVYASASRWNDVGLVRKLMIDNGVAKEPGCSLIEIDGITHELVAGDTSHPQTKEIYEFLKVIEERLESVGYVPDCSQAPMVDDPNDAKQHSLALHSERLATALGLLSLKPGTPIRIFKNLRVCNDCHKVTKLISQLFNVEIIMRDRTRFHHFKDGSCSCLDYW